MQKEDAQVMTAADTSERGVAPKRALALLAFVTIACFVPFFNKAYCIDDPLFLWSAAQIQKTPLNCYGRMVNWYETEMPLYEVTKNPPLTCYFIALAAAVVGWSEPALHAAFLIFSVGTIWGTWSLARRLCGQPVSAALVTLVTPVFLVSSTNVMCDTMLLCFWVWAIELWLRGLDSGQARWLACSGLMIAAAALTKYFGATLIPLLIAYTLIRERRASTRLAWILIPILLLIGYQSWTAELYGRGLLSDAAEYASSRQLVVGSPWLAKGMIAVCFTGGCCLPVLFCAPWVWSKHVLGTAVLLALVIAACLTSISDVTTLSALKMQRTFDWFTALQMGLCTTCGLLVIWLGFSQILRRRSAESCLLALWIFGTIAFAGFVNWTCNGRSVLPLIPALAILLVQRVEENARGGSRIRSAWRWALVPAGVVGLLVAWADMGLANSARSAAARLAETYRPREQKLWFEGHWGFQYYMELAGASVIDFRRLELDPGALVVVPSNNTNVHEFPQDAAEQVRRLEEPACPWLATLQYQVGAGFYATVFGPMPFVFGRIPTEKYTVWRVAIPLRSEQGLAR